MSEARINLPAKIFPTGNFETHEDIYGKGGFVVLNDNIGSSGADEFINERVTYQRRKEGMLVYVSSNSNYYRCVVTGSSESEGQWTQQYFSGRYFHGASAPTADNLRIGEKWFNTTVGSEFTYLPTDEDQDTFFWVDIDHLGQGETGFVRISGDVMTGALTTPFVTMTQGFTSSSGFIGTLTGNSSSFTSLTASNGFIGTLTGTSSSFTSLTASNGFIGTLTGTNLSFTSLTASNGFIGTLTGNNIRYTNAEFGTDSLIIQGSSATFTDMSVMITGNSSLKKHDLTIGTTFDAGNGQNPNVYRIFTQDGVALGGNNLSMNNWLGNNVFLSPSADHTVLMGFPLSYDATDQEKLTVTGGIVSDRIFVLGSGKAGLTGVGSTRINALSHALAAGITTVNGFETPLFSVQDRQPGGWVNAPKIRRTWPTGETGSTNRTDSTYERYEYVTKDFVNKGFQNQSNFSYTILPWGDSNIQFSFIKQNFTISWTQAISSAVLYYSQNLSVTIPNHTAYPNILSVVGIVADALQPTNHFSVKVISDTNTGGTFGCNIQLSRTNAVNPFVGIPDLNVNFLIVSAPS